MAEGFNIEVGLDDDGNTLIKATQIIKFSIDKTAAEYLYNKNQKHEDLLEVIAVSRLSGEEIRKMVSGYLKDLKDGKI